MADNTAPQDGSRPGVLGDYSQAQDLGQADRPEDRVSESDVKEAFQTENTPTSRKVEPLPEARSLTSWPSMSIWPRTVRKP